ncbi:NAD(P)/FAD-dependent oxidoreductase [Babesia caballi]|uniref:NAD(P)/FAD-dependent oxidoreductase n=1 Tax=Babesia caballi TaxID=5871 RepID=A0AAV4LRC0_BABCB|nr:NAD(P)/FAD-dependent oxidoreductase [Babesia caballi]
MHLLIERSFPLPEVVGDGFARIAGIAHFLEPAFELPFLPADVFFKRRLFVQERAFHFHDLPLLRFQLLHFFGHAPPVLLHLLRHLFSGRGALVPDFLKFVRFYHKRVLQSLNFVLSHVERA